MYKILYREWSLGQRALLVVFIRNVHVQISFLHLACIHTKKRYIEDIEVLDLLFTLMAL